MRTRSPCRASRSFQTASPSSAATAVESTMSVTRSVATPRSDAAPGARVGHDLHLAREDDALMVVLAAGRPHDGLHVLGPPPAGLMGAPGQIDLTENDDLRPEEGQGDQLVGLVEALGLQSSHRAPGYGGSPAGGYASMGTWPGCAATRPRPVRVAG